MSPERAGQAAASRGAKLRLAAAILVWPLGWLALRGAAHAPDLVERWYSNGVYVGVRQVQGALAGLSPVSLSELLLATMAAWLLLRGIHAVRCVRAKEVRPRELLRVLVRRAVLTAGALWAAFLLLWGFQHARRPYAFHANLEPQPVSSQQLFELSVWLVSQCNRLRNRISLADLTLHPGRGGVDARILAAYQSLGERVPALQGGTPLLRTALCSPLLSRLGISGIYSPFTGEAHLNAEVPPWVQPFSASHELAHQKGFAREDEANFIAWQVCRESTDPALNYSASFVALRHALGALRRENPVQAELVSNLLDDQVLADMHGSRAFWRSMHSVVTDLSIKVNDTYLKSSGSSEGVRSYGRMLDLLVAEQLSR